MFFQETAVLVIHIGRLFFSVYDQLAVLMLNGITFFFINEPVFFQTIHKALVFLHLYFCLLDVNFSLFHFLLDPGTQFLHFNLQFFHVSVKLAHIDLLYLIHILFDFVPIYSSQ